MLILYFFSETGHNEAGYIPLSYKEEIILIIILCTMYMK